MSEYLSLEDVTNVIKEQRDKELKTYQLITLVLEILENFHGKQVNRRIETALEKAMPSVNIKFYSESGVHYLEFWGEVLKRHEEKDRISLLLSYSNTFDITVFKQNLVGYLRSGDKAKLLQVKLQEAPKLVERYNGILDMQKKLLQDVGNVKPLLDIFKFT